MHSSSCPLVTVAVPSYNQGRFLENTLESIFNDDIPVEVFVMDAGSDDESLDIIKKWAPKLTGWRSQPDNGQAAAINEAIAKGTAPYVCWLNSDDVFLPGGLRLLLDEITTNDVPIVYAKAWNISEVGNKLSPYLTLPFNVHLFANYCFVSQPATMIKRDVWEQVGGVNWQLKMAMDYDLWWRIYEKFGPFHYMKKFVAGNRVHADTKTLNNVEVHYRESMAAVKRVYGRVPIKWKLFLPMMKVFRRITRKMHDL